MSTLGAAAPAGAFPNPLGVAAVPAAGQPKAKAKPRARPKAKAAPKAMARAMRYNLLRRRARHVIAVAKARARKSRVLPRYSRNRWVAPEPSSFPPSKCLQEALAEQANRKPDVLSLFDTSFYRATHSYSQTAWNEDTCNAVSEWLLSQPNDVRGLYLTKIIQLRKPQNLERIAIIMQDRMRHERIAVSIRTKMNGWPLPKHGGVVMPPLLSRKASTLVIDIRGIIRG